MSYKYESHTIHWVPNSDGPPPSQWWYKRFLLSINLGDKKGRGSVYTACILYRTESNPAWVLDIGGEFPLDSPDITHWSFVSAPFPEEYRDVDA